MKIDINKFESAEDLKLKLRSFEEHRLTNRCFYFEDCIKINLSDEYFSFTTKEGIVFRIKTSIIPHISALLEFHLQNNS